MTGTRMNQKENARRIIEFNSPEQIVTGMPSFGVGYHGANHQGYGDTGMDNGHDRPVGAKWHDIWNTAGCSTSTGNGTSSSAFIPAGMWNPSWRCSLNWAWTY